MGIIQILWLKETEPHSANIWKTNFLQLKYINNRVLLKWYKPYLYALWDVTVSNVKLHGEYWFCPQCLLITPCIINLVEFWRLPKLVSPRNLVNLLQFKYQALELWSKAVPESLSTDLLMWAVHIPGLRSVPRCLSISTVDSTFLAPNRCEKLYPMLSIFLFEKKWQGHGKQAQVHTWPCQLLATMTICKFTETMSSSAKYATTIAYLFKLWRVLNDKTMPGTEKAWKH